MSNLSELLPAGAGAKSADFVASGTLGSGATVALKADGTVEAVAQTTTTISDGASSPFTFANAATYYTQATYDSANNKVVIAYKSSSNYPTAIVGTVSGSSISFGTAVVVNSANTGSSSAITYASAQQKVVVVYTDANNSGYGTAKVGTVSGTSISFGAGAIVRTGSISDYSITYDSVAQRVVVFYKSGSTGLASVGTLSGTSISFGSDATFASHSVIYTTAAYDVAAQKVVVAYRNDSNGRGLASVGAVSGTSISFGTAVEFHNSSVSYLSIAYDVAAQKNVIAGQLYDVGSGQWGGQAIVGTVSGTSISFGSKYTYNSGATTQVGATYDANAEKVVIVYSDGGNSSYGTAIVGTVSGTAISYGAETVYESASALYNAATYDANAEKVVIVYSDLDNSSYGTSVVWTTGFTRTTTNSADFIGITDEAIANTSTGAVIVQGGVSDKVTGLTTGSDYYVQANGTLSTTTSTVPAGRALSSTSILLEG
jgi:hypothetical protein